MQKARTIDKENCAGNQCDHAADYIGGNNDFLTIKSIGDNSCRQRKKEPWQLTHQSNDGNRQWRASQGGGEPRKSDCGDAISEV